MRIAVSGANNSLATHVNEMPAAAFKYCAFPSDLFSSISPTPHHTSSFPFNISHTTSKCSRSISPTPKQFLSHIYTHSGDSRSLPCRQTISPTLLSAAEQHTKTSSSTSAVSSRAYLPMARKSTSESSHARHPSRSEQFPLPLWKSECRISPIPRA